MKTLNRLSRRKRIVVLALIFISAYPTIIVRWWYPWYTTSPSEKRVQQAETDLNTARERWQSHQPLNYRFTYSITTSQESLFNCHHSP